MGVQQTMMMGEAAEVTKYESQGTHVFGTAKLDRGF